MATEQNETATHAARDHVQDSTLNSEETVEKQEK